MYSCNHERLSDLWVSQLCPLPAAQRGFMTRFQFFSLSTDPPKVIESSRESVNLIKAYGFYQLNIICQKSQHGHKCHVVATTREHLATEKEWDTQDPLQSTVTTCGLSSLLLRLWGLVCRPGLASGQGVKGISGDCAGLGTGNW